MANSNMNGVPRVDRTARIPAKKTPVAPSGVGNPGSTPFGPGKVQTDSRNPSVGSKRK